MMEFIKEPFFCSFSKNSIEFNVITDKYYTSKPIYPLMNISIDSQPTVGSVYSLRFTNPLTSEIVTLNFNVVEFLASTIQTDWNLLVVDSSSPSVSNFRTELLKKLRSAPLLNSFYKIDSVVSNAVQLVANLPIEELILTFEAQQTSPFVEYSSEIKFNQPIAREGYQLIANVYLEKTYKEGNWELIASVPCVVNNDSICKLDIQTIIDSEIESNFLEQPIPKSDLYVNPYLYQFRVDFIESWTGESKNEILRSNTYKVHWGGISQDDEYMSNPVQLYSQSLNFLTFTPTGKRFSPGKNDYLAWMNTGKKDVFKISVECVTNLGVFTDNSYQVIELDEYETIVFNSGFTDALAIVSGSSTIFNWSWKITNSTGDTDLSNEFRYYTDKNCLKRDVLVYNSFGIPEVVELSKLEQSLNINQQLASRSEKFGLSSFFPKNFIFDSVSSSQYVGQTNFLKQSEARNMQALLNSTISYLYEDQRFIPIVLNSSTVQLYKNSEFLRFVSFDFQRANETDRTSVFEPLVTIEPYFDENQWFIRVLNPKGNTLSYGNLTVIFNGSGFGTFEWNAVTNRYEIGEDALSNESIYSVSGQITDSGSIIYNVSTKIKVVKEKIHFNFNTNVEFRIRSYKAVDTINIDWGNSVTIDYSLNNITYTTINYSYSDTFIRHGFINKLNLDDVFGFRCDQDVTFLEFDGMKKIKQLLLSNQAPRSYYLSALTELQLINISNSPIIEFELGCLPDIQYLILDNCSLLTEQLDQIILEVWKYRKQYDISFAGGPTFNFQNLGFIPSSLFLDVINGTGAYVGEGLVSDYFCTVNYS